MSSYSAIVPQVIDMIRQQRLPVGTHLVAQKIADHLGVSRSPVNEVLKLLCENGLVTRQENRGYFLEQDLNEDSVESEILQRLVREDAVSDAYFRLADDLLTGQISSQCSEVMLRSRYNLTVAQVKSLLARISHEGWVSPSPGYGWVFSPMMTTPESLLQSYRLRLALEPAALLEPSFHISPAVIERCREAEYHLLNGGIDTDTADQLHERGVRFHESLVEGSGNPYFIDTIRRVNRIRRLLSYRSMQNRARYREHCEQHLAILDLLEQNRNQEASDALRTHLQSTLKNLSGITDLLDVQRTQHIGSQANKTLTAS